MTKRVKRQIATFLLVTQLAFSLFAPFAPLAHLIPQAFASDDTQTAVNSDTFLSFSVEETDSSNQLVVKSNLEDSVELPYSLYYLNDHTTQALKGELVANSENVLFIGTQSNDDFMSHDWQKMVFKVQLGDEVRSYYLQKQTEGELVGRTFVTNSLEILSDDTQWISWLTDAENRVATTIENVVEGQEYFYPFNDKVSVTFTKLPEESGTLTITQIELDEELAEKFGTNIAFDITTTMKNGTFEFDLHLPQPENLENPEAIEVVYADTTADLLVEEKVIKVEKEEDGEQMVEVVEEEGVVKAKGLDHMTVFVVVGSGPPTELKMIVDNSDSIQYMEVGNGWRNSTCGEGYGDNRTRVRDPWSPVDEYKAEWSFSVPEDGSYKVLASWSMYSNRTDKAVYQLFDSESPETIIVDSGEINQKGANCGYSDFSEVISSVELSSSKTYKVRVINNGSGFLIADAVQVVPLSQPDEVWVDDNWSGNSYDDVISEGLIYGWNAFAKIQEGIDQVKEGGIVNVEAGVYYENLVVDRSVSLISVEGPDNTTIDGSNNNQSVIKISADHISLTGFTIIGSGTSNSLNIGGIQLGISEASEDGANNVYLDNNIISNNDYGIVIAWHSGNNLIENNKILNNQKYGVFSGQYSGNRYNRVINNEIIDNSLYGIYQKLGNTNTLLATNNWWGDNSGPLDNNAADYSTPSSNPGLGNAVEGRIDYSDWQERYPVPNTPTQIGYNVNDGTPIDQSPTKFACEGGFTNVNGVSVHWTDVADGDPNIKYQRQYKVGNGVWTGNEIYTNPYTNYRTFGSSTGNENIYYSQVRSFYDLNANNKFDEGEPVSDWSNSCSITFDKTAPNLDITYNGGIMVGGMKTIRSIEDLTYSGTYFDGVSGLNRTSFVIWTVDSDTLQPIIYEGNNTPHLCNWNGSGANINILNGLSNDSLNNISLSDCTSHAPAGWIYPDGTYRIGHVVYDNAGNQKSFGNSYFVIDSTAPEAPTGIRILNHLGVDLLCEGYTNNRRITVDWDDNQEPDFKHYLYDIKDKENFLTLTKSFNTGDIRDLDGYYKYGVKAVDLVGNISQPSKWCGVTLDRVDPFGSIDYLYYASKDVTRDYFVTNDRNPVLGGSCSDEVGLDNVTLTIDGHTETVACDSGQWRSTAWPTLADGDYEATLLLTDLAGNQATETQNLTIDSVAPRATHSYYKDDKLITDDISYVQGVSQLSFDGEYSDVFPSSGLYWDSFVIFEAQDDGSFAFSQNGKKAFCSWRNEPNLVDLTANPIFPEKRSFTDCKDSLDDGVYYMAHQVYDSATRKDIPSIFQFRDVLGLKFVIDSVAPKITWIESNDGDVTNQSPLLKAAADETLKNLRFLWRLQDEDWDSSTRSQNLTNQSQEYEWMFNPSVDGIYTLRAQGRDLALNWNRAKPDITVTVDKTRPTGTIITPTEGQYFSKQVEVTGTVSDNLSGVERVEVRLRQYPNNTYRTPWVIADLDSDGNYSVVIDSSEINEAMEVAVVVYDKAGNNKWLWPRPVITIDNEFAESKITFPENSESGDTVYLTQWDGTILGTAEDELSGLEKVELEIKRESDSYYWNGSGWQVDSYLNLTNSTDEFANWNFLFTPEADEIYYLTSHATDKAGNFEESYSITVVFDKTIPEVILTIDPANPDGSGSWYITRPTLTLKATDPSNSGLKNLQYQWDSKNESGWTTVNAVDNEAIKQLQPPKEGHSILYYRATDIAGNTFSETGVKNIYWDATDLSEGPLDVKADPNPTSGSTSTISWTKAEDNIGIAKYKVTWDLRDGDDDHSKEVSGNTTELKISDLKEGTYKVTVTAYDNAGHEKSASIDLVVNRTAPAAPILTLVGTTAGTATLSWNEVENATDYIILYGTESGNYQYAARVGNITQYTVEGLTAGSYFFVVRAVDNVDNQSGNSNEVNTGAILGAIGAAGPAAGFVEAGDVLGDQTDQEPTEEEIERAKAEAENGEVLGEQISCSPLKNLLPWIILGLQLVILLGVEIVMKRDSSAVKMVIALGTTIVAIALYYLLRSNSCYADGSLTMIIDRFFWLASGLLSVVIRFLGYGFIEVVDKE